MEVLVQHDKPSEDGPTPDRVAVARDNEQNEAVSTLDRHIAPPPVRSSCGGDRAWGYAILPSLDHPACRLRGFKVSHQRNERKGRNENTDEARGEAVERPVEESLHGMKYSMECPRISSDPPKQFRFVDDRDSQGTRLLDLAPRVFARDHEARLF